MNQNEIDTFHKAMNYIFSDKAVFTIHNEKTNVHFTYKTIKRKNPSKNIFWVYILTQANNEEKKDYKFIGAVSFEKGYLWSEENSMIKNYSKSNIVAEWFFKHLLRGTLFTQAFKNKFPEFKIYHLGYCLGCGKKLTAPESLKIGYGRECLGKQIKDGTNIISDKNDIPYIKEATKTKKEKVIEWFQNKLW